VSACNDFRSALANGDAATANAASHRSECDRCGSIAAPLGGAQALFRPEGVPALPAGFAARAARAAVRAPKQAAESLLDRFLPVAIPSAALAVVVAVLVFFGVGWKQPTPATLAIDPVTAATETPVALADPTPEILGVGD